MTILAVETSCDETGVALVREGRVLSNLVASQVDLHAEYGGVVPELAAREHLRHLLPLARQALEQAGMTAARLDAVAATRGPGLPNALLIGCQAAQALAWALGVPFQGIHHHEAHLYSPWLEGDPPRTDWDSLAPHVSLIVSGGHTLLVHVRGEMDHELLGSTVDDAAGECFDKVAKLIGLGYPGGPEIDRLAARGRPGGQRFPRPMLKDPNDDFSFSGLKTSVRYYLRDHPEVLGQANRVCDLCAEVQQAIVDVLVGKTLRAAQRLGVGGVTASGGVCCNRALRGRMAETCQGHGLWVRLAEPAFCTDNAAMIAILAERKLQRGMEPTPLDAEPLPGWPL